MKISVCVKSWIRKGRPAEVIEAHCLVCGEFAQFDSYESLDFPCKRNTFLCRNCGSIARNRHIAKVVLETFGAERQVGSLMRFAMHTQLTILNTCASGAVHDALKRAKNYHVSEYYEGICSGETVNGVMCQDLEETSFAGDTFDLILTEDVMEHVADPERVFSEIRRILKPGGYHVATIPVFWNQKESTTRAVLRDGQLRHLLEPEYHGDPNRPGGVLVFTDFGCNLVDRYCSIVGPTTVFTSHLDAVDETTYAIFNSWIFLSRKEFPHDAGRQYPRGIELSQKGEEIPRSTSNLPNASKLSTGR
jgi:SAM-dependent methyltransferase